MEGIAGRLCELAGTLLEVVGALYLANRYLSIAIPSQLPMALIRVVFNPKKVAGLILWGEKVSQENALTSLRGIALLISGFIVKSLPHIAYILTYIWQITFYKA